MAEVQHETISTDTSASNPPQLRELSLLFLRLGCTSFGGPAVHIAMMEDEVVTRRRWMSREKFLDLLGATNLIPGPNSTEMAMHIGMLAGWTGFLVAGACFILPAAIITGLLAWVYVAYGALPAAESILCGIKPVVIAVVLVALWKLGRDSLRTTFLAGIALAAAASNLLGVDEIVVLFTAGIVAACGRRLKWRIQPVNSLPPIGCLGIAALPLVGAAGGGSAVAAVPFGLWPLFLFFAKAGSVLFGSGYVLLAFLRTDLVERTGWLTETQLLDAIAIGQFTPGPVFTTATFIGYVLGGQAGAVVATVGIFLPAFFFVAVSGPLVPRLRRSPVAGDFLDGVIVASLAIMAVVTWQLGRAALFDFFTVALAVISLFLLVRYRLNSVWLILGGALVGLLAVAL
jgi:chromate transporter